MLSTLLVIFVIGYLAIALEHPLKVDKTASALLLGMLMWILYALGAESIVPAVQGEHFQRFVADNPALGSKSVAEQALAYVLNVDIVEHLGDITQTLFFDRSHDHSGAYRRARRIPHHHRADHHTPQAQVAVDIEFHYIFHVGHTRQPDHHDCDDHAAEETDSPAAGAVALCGGYSHCGKQWRRMVAHR